MFQRFAAVTVAALRDELRSFAIPGVGVACHSRALGVLDENVRREAAVVDVGAHAD